MEMFYAILSPIVAVLIAAFTSWQTSKAANKQIRAIKQLSILQLRTTIEMLEVEAYKAYVNKEDRKDEAAKLWNRMSNLRNHENVSKEELDEIEMEIRKLNKNAAYQNNFYFKIIHRQFYLEKAIYQISNQK